jgi:hypothetical protein
MAEHCCRVEAGCAESPTPCACPCNGCHGCRDVDIGSDDDDEVRTIFVRLIIFVSGAKASHDAKNDALQCIEVLQARLLP